MKKEIQIAIVIGLVLNEERKILLQRRVDPIIPDADGKWEFPGGKIKYGESPEAAVVRECKEETGCEIKVKRLLPLMQSTIWARADGGEQNVLVSCYESEFVSGLPQPLDKKVSDVGWFSKEEFFKMDTLRGIKDFINFI
jgi:8-oxo-dGTP diphosphatase